MVLSLAQRTRVLGWHDFPDSADKSPKPVSKVSWDDQFHSARSIFCNLLLLRHDRLGLGRRRWWSHNWLRLLRLGLGLWTLWTCFTDFHGTRIANFAGLVLANLTRLDGVELALKSGSLVLRSLQLFSKTLQVLVAAHLLVLDPLNRFIVVLFSLFGDLSQGRVGLFCNYVERFFASLNDVILAEGLLHVRIRVGQLDEQNDRQKDGADRHQAELVLD